MALPLSFSQRQACDELWAAFRAGRLLERDPLPQLTGQDRKNLLKYCTIEFRPELFGRNPKIYQARQAELVRKGYTDDQATVIAGMIFSMVGRAGKKC